MGSVGGAGPERSVGEGAGPGKWHVFITGHSLGGALATLFAAGPDISVLVQLLHLHPLGPDKGR